MSNIGFVYITNKANVQEDRDRMTNGNNGDLWEVLNIELTNKQAATRKVKSHNEANVVRGEMDVKDYIRNTVADVAADAMAEAAYDTDEQQWREDWSTRMYQIARRLAILEKKRRDNRREERNIRK